MSTTLHSQDFTVTTAEELQAIFADPVDSVVVHLVSGSYRLTPSDIVDSTCANCLDAGERVNATVGLHIRGRFVRLLGPADRSAVIVTGAGYGIFINRCERCIVENLTITGGARDTSGKASDAAIVVKHSSAEILGNRIVDNIGDSAVVRKTIVGVMGICGREGSALRITGNDIVRNSWDGIALYRGAEAVIEDNLVDGVDKATGQNVAGGRGVGIGVTWNARATIARNRVTRYWKGIGLFVDADGTVESNVVEDIITWGIALWDADKGSPRGRIRNNIIYRTGACGASITRAAQGADPGEFTGNVIVQTAQNPKYDSPDYYCYQCALALHAVPQGFEIRDNLFFDNRRATPDLPDNDIPAVEFHAAIETRCSAPNLPRAVRESMFRQDFCGKK